MKAKIYIGLMAVLAAVSLFVGCTITPGVNVGLSLDYYGGSFHLRPNASVGVYGHP